MIVVIHFLIFALATGASQQSQAIDSARAAKYLQLDSLYRSRDTSGVVAAARGLANDSTASAQFYRGIAAAWSGKSREATRLLRPLLDSGQIPQNRRAEVLRILSERYARLRNFDSAASVYETELSKRDSLSAKLRTSLDSMRIADSANSASSAQLLEDITSAEPPPPPKTERIPGQITFIALLFILFLLPKALQRFRIPGAITSLVLGAGAAQLGFSQHDPTVTLLSTLGIVALFLFAGLEVDGRDIAQNRRALVIHAAIWSALATVVSFGAAISLHVPPRAAALLSLAVVTPSTGFILSSLSQFGLNDAEQKSVRTYAIGSELIALAALFFVLQATSVQHLAVAIAAMVGIVLVIPVMFRAFARLVEPHAPKSEFAFLLMVAIVCAYLTRLLGVYYLVGAFLVGIAAQRYRSNHPAMTSEKMIDALESFGSVFIPFYFFHAGMGITSDELSRRSILIGIGLVVLLVPVRVAIIAVHRKVVLGERLSLSLRPASAMIPTLVFTLVLTEILGERFGLSRVIAGGLVLYTVINTLIPGFVLRGEPADFEDVEALPLE